MRMRTKTTKQSTRKRKSTGEWLSQEGRKKKHGYILSLTTKCTALRYRQVFSASGDFTEHRPRSISMPRKTWNVPRRGTPCLVFVSSCWLSGCFLSASRWSVSPSYTRNSGGSSSVFGYGGSHLRWDPTHSVVPQTGGKHQGCVQMELRSSFHCLILKVASPAVANENTRHETNGPWSYYCSKWDNDQGRRYDLHESNWLERKTRLHREKFLV